MVVTILTWIVFGFVVGLIARAIMPGAQSMGLIATTLLGVLGSFLGGLVTSLITGRAIGEMHTSGFIGSIIGAIVLLAIAGAAGRRRVV